MIRDIRLRYVQVPHSYKANVCRYKDQARYFYSAMVSSLDDAVDRVGGLASTTTSTIVPTLGSEEPEGDWLL